ncbi:hypothetical protein SUGI_0206110 [Cryptomeria japonica]|nr:hypothetical protein SUGI_0206110 [Cryptomeria japonica]
MAKGKFQLKRIQNPVYHGPTFSKGKMGLLKKASELSLLCDAKVALIIFSPTGKLFEFASPSKAEMAVRMRMHRFLCSDRLVV